ncbi:MAG TPA: hypothetical protein VKB77_03315 [Terriglobales bacterium]|nr:hypothetical protein [Terriglobales bacterium]
MMKKLLAAALLLILGLSWTPLTLAMLAAGARHRCCGRMHVPMEQLSAPAMCGSGRCCVSSDRTTTLPAVSPSPRQELQATGFVPFAPVETTAEAATPDAASPFRSCLDLGMILRI